MNPYNWQDAQWPHFQFSLEGVDDALLLFAEKAGRVSGILEALPEETEHDVIVDIILTEAIKTSQIEGEFPNAGGILSSIRKNLGLHYDAKYIHDKSAMGLGELLIDVRNTAKDPLTESKLFYWHKLLFSENQNVAAGQWRSHSEPMQVISGAAGKLKVHYEAPPSSIVDDEMKKFLQWFNETAPGGVSEIKRAPVRSAIAHLYFESIHPFEDGNGRIGRAIAEKALSQTLGRPVVLSLSTSMEAKKKMYYAALEAAQKSIEITPWIKYFVNTVVEAQDDAASQIEFTLKKTKFFYRFKDRLSERQTIVINRMLEEGPAGFTGGMNAKKYVGITKVSKATATRDMQDLLAIGAFTLAGKAGGRSTSYQLNL